jgi:hypothetical protein
MKYDNIREAVIEAQRFLGRYAEYVETFSSKTYNTGTDNEITIEYPTPRESGALRRASLDLTRALATMRKA